MCLRIVNQNFYRMNHALISNLYYMTVNRDKLFLNGHLVNEIGYYIRKQQVTKDHLGGCYILRNAYSVLHIA